MCNQILVIKKIKNISNHWIKGLVVYAMIGWHLVFYLQVNEQADENIL